MKFYGNTIVENALSKMLDSKVKFESVSWDINKGTANFKGFSIINKMDFSEKIFNAQKMILILNKEKLEKEKKAVFDEIYINGGTLNIVRDARGILNLSQNTQRTLNYADDTAYADEPDGSNVLYNLARSVRTFTIENSTINFTDYFIDPRGFVIICDNLNMNFKADPDLIRTSGFAQVECALSFRLPASRHGDGQFFLKSSMAAYQERADMEMTIETRGIDLIRFLPYFDRYTPFHINEGVFSSDTSFRMHNNMIDSLTTMVFHKLNFSIDPGMENSEFLAASVNQLAKYLTSSQGEILFDFVIKGEADNPAIGIGPKVQFAIGMVVIEELGKMMQEIQAAQE